MRFRRFLITSIIGFAFTATLSLAGWEKWYGLELSDNGICVQQTADRGYIAGGTFTDTSQLGHYTYVIKTDPMGDSVWSRKYKLGFSHERCVWIEEVPGGYLALANFVKDEVYQNGDFVIMRLDEVGDTVWTHPYHHSDSSEIGIKVFPEEDGGYTVFASAQPGSLPRYGLLIRADESGNVLWERHIVHETGLSCTASDIERTPDGGFIITGNKQVEGGAWDDAWVIKLDSEGNTIWSKAYGTLDILESAGEITCTFDGMYAFAGFSASSPADMYKFLLKIDGEGDTVWLKEIPLNNIDYMIGIPDGYLFSSDDRTLYKTDLQGDFMWERSYGGEESRLVCLAQTHDGGYIATGYVYPEGTGSSNDLWLLKVDSEGDTVGTDLVAMFTATPSRGYVPFSHRMTVQFTDQSFGNPTSWAWDFGDGGVSSEHNPTHTYTSADSFTVRLSVSDGTNADTIYSPVVLCCLPEDFYVSAASICASVELPITCGMPVSTPATLSIYNSSGRLVRDLFSDNIEAGEHVCVWDLKDNDGCCVTPGVYFFKLDTPNGQVVEKSTVIR